jgi:hypothetical protein
MAIPTGTNLQMSDLNPFIFAHIGTEPNGSTLTVLSLLARLGSDPWIEARRLADQPRKAAAEWLAERIALTPLTLEYHGDVGRKAADLVALLPTKVGITMIGAVLPIGPRAASGNGSDALFGATPTMRWITFIVIWIILAVGAATGTLNGNTAPHKPSPPTAGVGLQ